MLNVIKSKWQLLKQREKIVGDEEDHHEQYNANGSNFLC